MRPDSRKLGILCVLVVLMTAVGTLAYGQGAANAGSLSGTVADQSGAILPGVDVTLKNNSTGAVSHAVTDSMGKFEVPSLEPGSYTVTVSLMGFKTAQLPDVVVAVGAPSSLKKITLDLGEFKETVVVTGATQLVQAESATVSTTLTTAQISRVPLATRNTLDFVASLPGVNTSRYGRHSTVMGLQYNAISITIDGMNVQDNFGKSSEGLFAIIHPRMDAIAEVAVSTSSPGADSTGQGAVQIRLATRSGTNRFQGSAYGYYRRTPWNTNYWFNERDGLPRDESNLDVQGFRLGGPVKRDTLFFFFNYEQFDLPGATQVFSRTVLTDSAAAGIFNYKVAGGGIGEVNLWALAAQYNQLATYDPVVQQMLADVKATLGQGTVLSTGSPHTQAFKYSSPSLEQVRRFPTLRMDYNVTPKHRVGVSYYYQQFEAFPVVGAEARYPGFPGASGQASNRWSAMGNWRWVVSSNLVSEVRGGSRANPSHLNGWKLTKDSFADYNGFYLTTPIMSSPMPLSSATDSDTPTSFLEDTVTWIKGRHTLSMGATFTQVGFTRKTRPLVPRVGLGVDGNDPAQVSGMFAAANFPGSASTDRTNAANLYALLTGRVTSITGNAYLDGTTGEYVYLGEATEMARQREFGFYAQDSWRARPDLTLTLGLRYELQLPFVARNNYYTRPLTYANLFGLSGVTADGSPNLFAPCGGTGYPACTGTATQFRPYEAGEKSFETDLNNLAPSAGVAWRPTVTSRWLKTLFSDDPVFRAGYSLAYLREGLAIVSSNYSYNPGGFVTAARNMSLGNLVASNSQLPVLFRDPSLLGPPSFPTSPVYPITGTSNDSPSEFYPGTRTPYAHTFTVSFQRALSKNTAVDIRYVGTRGRGGWVTAGTNLSEYNLENGFLDEFKNAQRNLAANLAAGKGATMAYTGAAGTVPLPTMLSYLAGIPASGANDPTKYTSAQFASTTWMTYLAIRNPNPVALATALQTGSSGSTLYRNNATAAGLPANYFILNPMFSTGGVWVAGRPEENISGQYDAFQFEVRRRMSDGLLVQGSYQYVLSSMASSQYTLKQSSEWIRNPLTPIHAFKVNWLYDLPFGQGRKFASGIGRSLNMLVGGWSFDGNLRAQSGNVLDFGNVRLNGFTDEDLHDMFQARLAPDQAGTMRVYMLPQDVIDNTIKAYSIGATSSDGYSLGAPTGRYFSPASGPDCIEAYPGSCNGGRPRHHYVTGPALLRVDVALAKRLDITKRVWADLRLDVLNLFDNINYFGTTMTSPFTAASNYEVTSAYRDPTYSQDPGGRVLQVSWRVSF